eukprot:CAMPEP_0113474690 /NCGR_PEP_ID=MMETSP0014_2-20120614/18721_1 /TAXON_ID=2857 /ORGANISM="Nitzschia sp." /LENGTH=258 /DNA_ID=CAMNT_0000367559 /DNA_START=30 /DNA_END=806 /DNA_ORIENTATION=- /assembly_acc=CAM_ASM_000159
MNAYGEPVVLVSTDTGTQYFLSADENGASQKNMELLLQQQMSSPSSSSSYEDYYYYDDDDPDRSSSRKSKGGLFSNLFGGGGGGGGRGGDRDNNNSGGADYRQQQQQQQQQQVSRRQATTTRSPKSPLPLSSFQMPSSSPGGGGGSSGSGQQSQQAPFPADLPYDVQLAYLEEQRESILQAKAQQSSQEMKSSLLQSAKTAVKVGTAVAAISAFVQLSSTDPTAISKTVTPSDCSSRCGAGQNRKKNERNERLIRCAL